MGDYYRLFTLWWQSCTSWGTNSNIVGYKTNIVTYKFMYNVNTILIFMFKFNEICWLNVLPRKHWKVLWLTLLIAWYSPCITITVIFLCWMVFKTICWLIALFLPIIVCYWSKFHCANYECLIWYNLVEVMTICIWNTLYDNHSWLIISYFMKVGSMGSITMLLYSYVSQ